MTAAVSFTVPGRAAPQPRQRHRLARDRLGRPVLRNYVPRGDAAGPWKMAVRLAALAARRGGPRAGPLALTLTFVLPAPRGRRAGPRGWHAARPDLDNLAKAVLDALNGVLWADDAQVAVLHCVKHTAAAGEAPCLQVSLTQIADAP